MRVLGLPPDIGIPGQPLEKVGQQEPMGPCGQYRIKYPFEQLNKLGAHAEYGAYPLEYVWEYAREFDVIVLHRQTMPQMQAFVEHCRLFLGKKVVLDVDDAVLDLDPRNPAYVWWGKDRELVWRMFCQLREEHRTDERLAEVTPERVWAMVRANREGFTWMLRNVDLVTVTTPFLLKEYKKYSKNVVVLPNCIRTGDWEGLEPKRLPGTTGKLVLGWAGGDSHAPDLKMARIAVARVLRRFSDVVFVIVGFPKARELFPEDVRGRIFAIPWSSLEEYRGWLGGFDIGLAPSQRIVTNRAKSGIRIYEYALAKTEGMAVVATPWPYRADVHPGMGTVAENDARFYKAIVRYIQDERLRLEHGRALREHVLSEHTTEVGGRLWLEAYGDLLEVN